MRDVACDCLGVRHFCGLPTPTRERVQIDARDAEIAMLRQGITRLKALASLPGDSPGLPLMRLGMIRQEATELLKGGGDGC